METLEEPREVEVVEMVAGDVIMEEDKITGEEVKMAGDHLMKLSRSLLKLITAVLGSK